MENILRALALPAGETIRYRYEKGLVSQTFKDAAATAGKAQAPIIGDTAYLCYLDNRDPSRPTALYPIREATITNVSVRGTTYLIQLELQCFLSWLVDPQLDQTISGLAIDRLPYWQSRGRGRARTHHAAGLWLAETKPLPSNVFARFSVSGSHLHAFESAATALSRGSDFSDGKRLFTTIIGLRQVENREPVCGEKLRAGRFYELSLYHVLPGASGSNSLEDFRLEAASDNADVAVVGYSERRVEAAYDEVAYVFRVSDDAIDSTANLYVNVKRVDPGQPDPVYLLRGAVKCEVASARTRKAVAGVIIGLGLFGAQAVTLWATGKANNLTVLAVLGFALLAGLAAAFKLRTRI